MIILLFALFFNFQIFSYASTELKDVKIRIADENDVDSLEEMILLAGKFVPIYDLYQKINSYKTHPKDIFLIASISDKICGAISLNVIESFYETGFTAKIDILVIDPSHKHEGIAKLLISKIEDYAKNVGCSRIILTSKNLRPISNDLYEALGYTDNQEISYQKDINNGHEVESV